MQQIRSHKFGRAFERTDIWEKIWFTYITYIYYPFLVLGALYFKSVTNHDKFLKGNHYCKMEELCNPKGCIRRRQWYPIPVLLPGKLHGQRSLVGCSPWGALRVGNNWATSLSLFTFMHWRRKWQPTPVFLPGRIPGTGEPDGLPSMASHRVGHDWGDLAAKVALLYI